MKGAKKVWAVIEEHLKWILIFLSGGIVWMFFDVYVTKGIDASFVSAIMDAVMAWGAVLAYLTAKRIWSSKSKEDGYKVASDLINYKLIDTVMKPDLMRWLMDNNVLIKNYIHLNHEWQYSLAIDSHELNIIRILSEQMDSLKEKLYEIMFPLSQESQFDIFRMRNMSVDFAINEHGELLKKHFEQSTELTITCENYLQCLKGFFSFHEMRKSNGKINVIHDRGIIQNYIDEMNDFNEIINKIINSMRSNLNFIVSESKVRNTSDYFMFK